MVRTIDLKVYRLQSKACFDTAAKHFQSLKLSGQNGATNVMKLNQLGHIIVQFATPASS
jgi:hypothetical protein